MRVQITEGLCHCGCGQRTGRVGKTCLRRGRIKGEFNRYVFGHAGVDRSGGSPGVKHGPLELCRCGCGEVVPHVRDHFLRGHAERGRRVADYTVDPSSGCWVWRRKVTARGYGIAYVPGGVGQTAAHRLVYSRERGPIPDGMHLHHLCRNKICVNPDHLEPVDPVEHRKLHPRRSRRPRLVPPDLHPWVARYAELHGLTYADVIREALRRMRDAGDPA